MACCHQVTNHYLGYVNPDLCRHVASLIHNELNCNGSYNNRRRREEKIDNFSYLPSIAIVTSQDYKQHWKPLSWLSPRACCHILIKIFICHPIEFISMPGWIQQKQNKNKLNSTQQYWPHCFCIECAMKTNVWRIINNIAGVKSKNIIGV